jgi:hypothetical protein
MPCQEIDARKHLRRITVMYVISTGTKPSISSGLARPYTWVCSLKACVWHKWLNGLGHVLITSVRQTELCKMNFPAVRAQSRKNRELRWPVA